MLADMHYAEQDLLPLRGCEKRMICDVILVMSLLRFERILLDVW